jgi:predicted transcriptional regulator
MNSVENIYDLGLRRLTMNDANMSDRWRADRTTFERVYDVLVGSETFSAAGAFAERADCSETAARNALEQLAEMGIAERREGRPTTYRRNDSYFRWKRIESLSREHDAAELRERVDELIAEDEAFQETYGVPDPNAVSTADVAVDDHEELHERWEDLSEWHSVRRDIRDLRRAVERREARVDDGLRA